MKKLISILGIVTITSSAIPTVIAATPYQPEEKILKRNKRWGEVQWIQIAQQWRNAELAYQRAGEDFQRNQNHTAFSQAQQRFLQAQQSFNNSKDEWQQGLIQWANKTRQERNQQWWNNNNSSEAHEAERQWVYNKTGELANKIGTTTNTQKINENLQNKRWGNNECTMGMAVGGALAAIGAIFIPFLGAIAAIYGVVSVACSIY